MKNPAVIAKQKIHTALESVFRWRGLDGTPLRGMLALLIVGTAFAVFAATVRIHVSAPQQWVEKKASVIQLLPEGEGKIWALRAQEGGPFPSRLDPLAWEKSSGAADAVLRAGDRMEPYEPKLLPLPGMDGGGSLITESKDDRVFPRRTVPKSVQPAAVKTKLMPMLYPLAGVPLAAMPKELPPFDAQIDTSAPWRFMLRLDEEGGVIECLSFADDPGGNVLANWLRGVNFGPEVAKKAHWIGIGVGFNNQPIDGPDPR